jgi:hypothetical protein
MRDTRVADEYELESKVDEAAVVDHALGALAAKSRAHELELARWLLRAEAVAVHRRFGCASLAEYVERRLGLSARELREKLRVARALETLPALAEALRTGAQSWSAVRELTRVATPETEAEWLAFSRGRTVRQLERKVALHQRGDAPRSPRLHAHAPRRVVFEVAPEDLSVVRAAMDVLWQELGGGKESPTPGKLLVAMAEVVLGKRAVESAAYQTSVTICAGARARGSARAGSRWRCRTRWRAARGVMGRWWAWRRCRRRTMCSPRRAWARPTWVMGPGHRRRAGPRPTWVMRMPGEPATHDADGTTHVGHEAAALQHLRELATRGGPGRCCG